MYLLNNKINHTNIAAAIVQILNREYSSTIFYINKISKVYPDLSCDFEQHMSFPINYNHALTYEKLAKKILMLS